MSENTKLKLSILLMFTCGIFATFFGDGVLSKVAGVLALGLSVFGVVAMRLQKTGRMIWGVKSWHDAKHLTTMPPNEAEANRATQAAALARAPIPALSPYGAKQLKRAVSVLGSFGVFLPETPMVVYLQESVADYGEPVTLEAVLFALEEANYYHSDLDITRYTANLIFIPSKTEQFKETIETQLRDIIGIYKSTVAITDLNVSISDIHRISIRMMLNGECFECDYKGFPKYLSSTPFVKTAKWLHALGSGERLACFWSDQGAHITCISANALHELNSALGKGLLANSTFTWLDEEESFDASTITSSIP